MRWRRLFAGLRSDGACAPTRAWKRWRGLHQRGCHQHRYRDRNRHKSRREQLVPLATAAGHDPRRQREGTAPSARARRAAERRSAVARSAPRAHARRRRAGRRADRPGRRGRMWSRTRRTRSRFALHVRAPSARRLGESRPAAAASCRATKPATHAIACRASTSRLWPRMPGTSARSPTANGGSGGIASAPAPESAEINQHRCKQPKAPRPLELAAQRAQDPPSSLPPRLAACHEYGARRR